jgi:hypothetical protein
MTYLTSNVRNLSLTFIWMLALGVGCASKNDSLGGTGGGTGGLSCGQTDSCGGTFGTGGGSGGLSQSGGAPGDGGVDYQAMLEAGEAAWANVKCQYYVYSRTQSSFSGWCAVTGVSIQNDLPVARTFVSGEGGCPPNPDGGVTEQWGEDATQIGTHPDGEPAETIEQLFAECQGILALDPTKYTFFLSLGYDGTPATCTATLIQCVDDCTTGIEMSGFACAASVTAG